MSNPPKKNSPSAKLPNEPRRNSSPAASQEDQRKYTVTTSSHNYTGTFKPQFVRKLEAEQNIPPDETKRRSTSTGVLKRTTISDTQGNPLQTFNEATSREHTHSFGSNRAPHDPTSVGNVDTTWPGKRNMENYKVSGPRGQSTSKTLSASEVQRLHPGFQPPSFAMEKRPSPRKTADTQQTTTAQSGSANLMSQVVEQRAQTHAKAQQASPNQPAQRPASPVDLAAKAPPGFVLQRRDSDDDMFSVPTRTAKKQQQKKTPTNHQLRGTSPKK